MTGMRLEFEETKLEHWKVVLEGPLLCLVRYVHFLTVVIRETLFGMSERNR